MKSERLFSILLLRTRGPVPATEHAGRLEASVLGLDAAPGCARTRPFHLQTASERGGRPGRGVLLYGRALRCRRRPANGVCRG